VKSEGACFLTARGEEEEEEEEEIYIYVYIVTTVCRERAVLNNTQAAVSPCLRPFLVRRGSDKPFCILTLYLTLLSVTSVKLIYLYVSRSSPYPSIAYLF
jgi:hypothetical protein